MTINFNIVLIEPEIPQNTGNIVRLCACSNSELYLVGKLGFSLSNKYTKRAGLDYWGSVNIHKYETIEDLIAEKQGHNFYFLTTKTTQKYTDIQFKQGDFLVFGPETRGIDENILERYKENNLTIPMAKGQRSLNLSNSVAIVLYEGIRQNGTL